jgi:hypothetical protein
MGINGTNDLSGFVQKSGITNHHFTYGKFSDQPSDLDNSMPTSIVWVHKSIPPLGRGNTPGFIPLASERISRDSDNPRCIGKDSPDIQSTNTAVLQPLL